MLKKIIFCFISFNFQFCFLKDADTCLITVCAQSIDNLVAVEHELASGRLAYNTKHDIQT